MLKKSPVRRALKWLGGLLLVFVVLVLAMPWWTPLLGGVVASSASGATGMNATLERLQLNLVGGSALLSGLRLEGDGARGDRKPAEKPFFELGRFEARFSTLGALGGGPIVEGATIARLTLHVERDASGRWNFEPLLEAKASEPEQSEPSDAEPLAAFKPGAKIEVSEFSLEFNDAVTGRRAKLERGGLTLEVLDGKTLKLAGALELPAIELGGAKAIEALVAKLDGQIALAAASESGAPPVSGRLAVQVTGKRVSFEALAAELPQAQEATNEDEQTESAPPPDPNAPLMELSPSVRALLAALELRLTTKIDSIELAGGYALDGFSFRFGLNDDEIAGEKGRMKIALAGAVLPAAPEPGALKLDFEMEHTKAQPPMAIRYELERFPLSMRAGRRIGALIERYVPFPLLEKIRFQDQEFVLVGLRGADRWVGLDPRAVKKSLRSEGEDRFELPKGLFELGLDLSRFVDPAVVERELEKRMGPLKAELEPLERRRAELEARIERERERIEAIRNDVKQLEEAAASARKLIGSLEGMAAFSTSAKERLEKLREKIAGFEAKIQKERGEEGKAAQLIARLKKERQDLEQKLAAKRAELEARKEELRSQLDFTDDPFRFGFDSVGLGLRLNAPEPWDGQGGLEGLRTRPASRVELLDLGFGGKETELPRLSGWWDLEGRYQFALEPSPAMWKKIEAFAPPLAKAIRDAGGMVRWGPDGFDSALFRVR